MNLALYRQENSRK